MSENGFWMVIFRCGKVFVPTMAQTEAGFFLGIEPVAVLDEKDLDAIESAIVSAVKKGNPKIPTPGREEYKADVLLKHSGVKSLSTFARLARTWNLSRQRGAFLISPSRPAQHGGSEEDSSRQESLPDTLPLKEIARRLLERGLTESADLGS
jgi:hypothetical protein